jgi:uncharacterized membrane protein YraQ (UPF0718 family)
LADTLSQLLHVIGKEAGRMWWFTLFGVTLAALIKTFQWDRKVRQYVGKFGIWSIFIATGIGMFSPLCSCGILPVIIPMALSGVPLAPLMALLVVSPVMDPTSFFLTWEGVGFDLALWKMGGAAFLGLSAGFITHFLVRGGYFSGNIVRMKPVHTPEGELASAYDIGCANGLILRTMTVTPRDSRFRFFIDRFIDVGLFVGLWVGLAIVLEALIHVFVPIQWVTWLVGQEGPGSVAAAALIALPLPAHQIPVVPILAGLQIKGIAVGADLAFLMAGPVTSIPAMAALSAIFLPRVVVIFIAIGLTGSVLLGLLRMALG